MLNSLLDWLIRNQIAISIILFLIILAITTISIFFYVITSTVAKIGPIPRFELGGGAARSRYYRAFRRDDESQNYSRYEFGHEHEPQSHAHRADHFLRIPFIIFMLMAVIGVIIITHTGGIVPETIALQNPPKLCASAQPTTTAIVFIHGWTGDATASWTPMSEFACKDERLANVDIYGANYPTFIIRRNLHISSLATWLLKDFFIEELFPKYDSIHIVAHSMGGLIGRSVALNDFIGKSTSKIKSLISVGSPYQGATLAALGSYFDISTELLKDMAPGSVFLDDLSNRWDFVPVAEKPVTFCIGSPQDAVVTRPSSQFKCDCPFDYPAWGHIELVKPIDPDDERYKVPIRALIHFINGERGCRWNT